MSHLYNCIMPFFVSSTVDWGLWSCCDTLFCITLVHHQFHYYLLQPYLPLFVSLIVNHISVHVTKATLLRDLSEGQGWVCIKATRIGSFVVAWTFTIIASQHPLTPLYNYTYHLLASLSPLEIPVHVTKATLLRDLSEGQVWRVSRQQGLVASPCWP